MLRVIDLMQKDVRAIDEDAMVSDAILLLADGHVGGLPVLTGHRQLVGIISASDILAAEAETGDGEALSRVATHTRVGDLMTPSQTIADALVKLAAGDALPRRPSAAGGRGRTLMGDLAIGHRPGGGGGLI
jgi:CBS domain-containing protein